MLFSDEEMKICLGCVFNTTYGISLFLYLFASLSSFCNEIDAVSLFIIHLSCNFFLKLILLLHMVILECLLSCIFWSDMAGIVFYSKQLILKLPLKELQGKMVLIITSCYVLSRL